MSEAERRLAEDLQLRNDAREVVTARVERIRDALADKPVPRRALDQVVGGARKGLDEASDIAGESRWIIAATVVGVLLWLFRTPLLSALEALRERLPKGEPPSTWQRWRVWITEKVKR